MIQITSNTREVERSLRDDQEAIERGIRNAQSEVGELVRDYARHKHRYKSRTGTLQRATRHKVTDDIARVYIDRAMANYGQYIHEGHKGWAPDPFIEEAFNANQKKIESIIDKHIQKELRI